MNTIPEAYTATCTDMEGYLACSLPIQYLIKTIDGCFVATVEVDFDDNIDAYNDPHFNMQPINMAILITFAAVIKYYLDPDDPDTYNFKF
jgi:type III secretory pathway lipoprotein EscJ